jgi:hypothetical protein
MFHSFWTAHSRSRAGLCSAIMEPRYDARGLALLPSGARVVAMTADTATIRTVAGATLTFYRFRRASEEVRQA